MVPINKLSGFFLMQACRTFQQKINKLFVEDNIPLNIDQWPVLLCLITDGAQTQQELAIATQKDKANLGRNIEALERNGLVERKVSKTDRRKKIVSASPKAIELVPRIKAVLINQSDFTTADIAEEELEVFRNVIRKMMYNAQGEQSEVFLKNFMQKIEKISKIK
ncbi:MarR family transcriptional regulator [Prolixibacteraceae bacterium JC049]|nr:MarR family transcriptional regulator [Prolixibacteraceae bacterium JC049]